MKSTALVILLTWDCLCFPCDSYDEIVVDWAIVFTKCTSKVHIKNRIFASVHRAPSPRSRVSHGRKAARTESRPP